VNVVSLMSLWTPIVLSAAAVFLLSFLTHMVLTHHRADYRKAPSEDQLMDAMRPFAPPPGDYMIPRPQSMEHMRSKEFQERLQRGPVFFGTFMPPGNQGMGKQLVLWFIFCGVVSLFCAYIASRTLPAGIEYLDVMQIVSTTAFLCYSMSRWSDVIWYRRSAATALRYSLDGLLFALTTGGIFGWYWGTLV
jgi:hypothetical protein